MPSKKEKVVMFIFFMLNILAQKDIKSDLPKTLTDDLKP